MGLFDSLVTSRFPGQDDGSADGLLAQLTRSFMAQNGNNAPAPNAAQPAPFPGSPPIAQADPAAIPQQAQPAIGQQPQESPQIQLPDFLNPNSGGGGLGDHLMAGMNNFANAGGLLPALAGGIQGLLSGQRTDPQGLQQQTQKATFESLKSAGVPPNLAFAATMNPEILKTIAPAYFDTAPKLQETGVDPLTGDKKFAEYRPGRGLTPIGGGAVQDGSAPSMGMLQKAINSGVSGNDLYQYLPASMAPMVKAMIEGRQPLPTGTAMRNPATLALIDAAHAIDPTFDAASWKGRQSGVVDFASGKSSEMVRSANQTLHHTGKLLESMDDLHNRSIPAWNYLANTANEMTGGGAPTAFRINAHAVAEEMSKVFKGANLSDAEIRQWEGNLGENMSPEQQRAAVGKLKDLLHGSLDALEEKRTNSIGPMAAAKQGPLIKEEGVQVLKKLDAWLARGSAPKAENNQTTLSAGQSTTINGVTIKRVN